jgi:hypothetical protein
MKLSSIGLSLANVESTASQFDALPKGTYDATIDNVELRTTKAGTGQFLSVELTVVGPTHANRKLWANLNIQNPNPKAQEIGLAQLKGVFDACGLVGDADTDETIGHLVKVQVSIDKNDATRNQVQGFFPSNAQVATPAQVAQAPVQPAAGPTAMPWQKK